MPKATLITTTLRDVRFALIRTLARGMPVALNLAIDGRLELAGAGLVHNVTVNGEGGAA